MTKMSYKVPFNPDGNLLHDVDGYLGFDRSEIDWRDPKPFKAMIRIKDYHRSGHSVYYTWERLYPTPVIYPMLANDVLAVIKDADISGGWVVGTWEIVKRGRAYGIRKVTSYHSLVVQFDDMPDKSLCYIF